MFDLSTLLISVAHAAEPVVPAANAVGMQEDTASVLMRFMPFFLILMVFYFLIIRPQQKKADLHETMLKNLKKGDKVLTAAGFVGTITKLEGETYVVVEIAKGIEVKVIKSTISGPLDERVAENQNTKK